MKQFFKCTVLFLIMGAVYYLLEVLYDGSSHFSMFLVAGICGVFGDLLNELQPDMKIRTQCLMITALILLLEYIVGVIVNIWLGLGIWDYSRLPFNLHGQICLSFGLIWFFIFSPLIIWIGDALRHYFWREEDAMSLFTIYKSLFLEIANPIVGIREET